MTTLKSFQAEIEQISNEKQKQAFKEAREAHASVELAKYHGKVNGKKEVDNGNGLDIREEVQEVPIEVCELSWLS